MQMLSRAIQSPLLAIMSAGIILGFGLYLDRLENSLFQDSERAHFQDVLAAFRSDVEYTLADYLGALQTIDALILADPDIDDATFQMAGESLRRNLPAIREVQLSPGGVVSYVYPPERAAAVRGLNILRISDQRELAEKTIAERQVHIAGPLELKQGGFGMIARKPVSIGHGENPAFWGFVTIIIDFTEFMSLFDDHPAMDSTRLAIRGRNGMGEQGEVFYGDPQLFEQDSQTMTVTLPTGSWQLAGIPRAGWQPDRPGRSLFLVAAITLAALIGLLIFFAQSRSAIARIKSDELEHTLELMDRTVELLTDTEERFSTAVQGASVGLWDWPDRNAPQMWFAPSFYEMLDREPGEVPATLEGFLSVVEPNDREHLRNYFLSQDGDGKTFQDEFRIIRKDGEQRWHLLRGASKRSADGQRIRLSGSLQDIMAVKVAEAEVRRMLEEREQQATHDMLTGLLNRRGFDERWQVEISRAQRNSARLLVMILDADHFKSVNDTYGHSIGDKVLQQLAATLQATLREADLCARFGGEEFVVVLVDTELEAGLAIAERLRANIAEASVDHGQGGQLSVTCSIGLCAHQQHVSFDQTLHRADQALYQAKESGRNKVIAAPTT